MYVRRKPPMSIYGMGVCDFLGNHKWGFVIYGVCDLLLHQQPARLKPSNNEVASLLVYLLRLSFDAHVINA